MNTTVEIFKNEEFGQIDIYLEDGKEFFDANQVAKALGYERPNDTIRQRCKGTIEHSTLKNKGGYPLKLIPEGDLYRLIIGSQLKSAQKFEKWIFDEVLPSIRKNGAYMTEATLEKALTDPDFLIQLATQLKLEQEKRKALELENKIMKPKAEYFDDLVDKKLLTNFRDTAKELGIGQKKLITWLLDNGYLYRDKKKNLKAYQLYIDKGLFEYKDFVKGGFSSTQTLVTVKGKETIRLLIK